MFSKQQKRDSDNFLTPSSTEKSVVGTSPITEKLDKGSPVVSIGMPVRNGENYIRRAIESIQKQTFRDWELVICDNASTDATEQIVREYAAEDSRVHYFRNPKDIGPAGNHNRCFALSKGRYFRWHAHDDMIAPEYLAVCVAALDADAGIVCAHTQTEIVDHHEAFLENYDFHLRTDAASASTRFGQLVLVNHRHHRAVEIFGLMRSSALRQTPLEGSFARADSVLLARMALLGRFVFLPGRYFLSRSHPSQSMQQLPARLKNHNGRALWTSYLGTGPLPPPEWWDKSLKGRITFPEWRLFAEYYLAVKETQLSFTSKVKSYLVLLAWLFMNTPKLLRDLAVATEQGITGVFHRSQVQRPAEHDAGHPGLMADADESPIAIHGP